MQSSQKEYDRTTLSQWFAKGREHINFYDLVSLTMLVAPATTQKPDPELCDLSFLISISNILDHREKWKSKNKASKPWKEVKRSSKIIRGIMILSKLILKPWHRTIKSKPLQWFIHFLNESWLFMKRLKAVLNNRKKSQHWERHKRPPMNHLKASPMHIITIPLSNSHCN